MEHTIVVKDLRPIGHGRTKICTLCGCTGRNLQKYKTCEEYRKKPFGSELV